MSTLYVMTREELVDEVAQAWRGNEMVVLNLCRATDEELKLLYCELHPHVQPSDVCLSIEEAEEAVVSQESLFEGYMDYLDETPTKEVLVPLCPIGRPVRTKARLAWALP